MDVLRFPFVRFLLAFVLGLLMGMYGVVVSLAGAVVVFVGLLGVYMGLALWQSCYGGGRWLRVGMGMVALGALTMAGVIRFLQTRLYVSDEAHVMHHAEGLKGYEGVVVDRRVGERYGSVVLELRGGRGDDGWRHVMGKVMVWMPLEVMCGYRYGDVLRVEGGIERIRGPRNPNAFDYRQLAGERGIYHEGFVHGGERVVCCGYAPRHRVMAMAYGIRSFLAARLGAAVNDGVVRSAVLGLVLGVRDEVDKEVLEAFSMAGILHIFAVSGLHVGMLYMLLVLLLGVFGGVGYRRRGLQGVVIVFVLWAYAFVTALSASVIRSVMMVSLATAARLLGRRYEVWHGLSVSALVGLLYDPLWLKGVGFQLSYVAVIGIRLFYRRGVGLWEVKHWFLRRMWRMVWVSVSVQWVALPLCVYHFHYFPTYFLLGNVVGVPAASLLLGLGLLCCVFGKVAWLGSFFGWLLTVVGRVVYGYVLWIKGLPYAPLGPFWPSLESVVLGYGVMVGLLAFFWMKKLRYLFLATLCSLAVSVRGVFWWYRLGDQSVMVVYAVRKHRVMAVVQGRYAVVLNDDTMGEDSVLYKREVAPSLDSMGVCRTVWLPWYQETHTVEGVMRYKGWKGLVMILWAGKKVVCLDKDSVLPPSFAVPHVVDVLMVDGYRLRSLMPWLRALKPKVVVLGYGLSRRQRECLRAELAGEGVTCHDLLEDGAFIVRLSRA